MFDKKKLKVTKKPIIFSHWLLTLFCLVLAHTVIFTVPDKAGIAHIHHGFEYVCFFLLIVIVTNDLNN